MREVTFKTIFLAGLGATLLGALSACSTKTITKPRSQIIAEAQSSGISLPPVEVEREAFFQEEADQRERVLNLVRVRAAHGFRDAAYKIGVGDEIELAVFDVPELNVSAKVRASGFVSLPLIGALEAKGLTESELHDELTKRLATYVRNPQVNVSVSQYGSQMVAVMGAVQKPGTYALKKGTNSILELISEAGGVSSKAGNYLNFIPAEFSGVSASNDVETRARLALSTADAVDVKNGGIQIYLDQVLGTSGGIPLEIPVRGGDMVVIPEAGKVMVEGEVEKVGSYDLNQQTTLLGALAAAGGITYSAKVDEVEVVREAGVDKKLRLVMDLTKIANGEEKDIRLKNGDIVRVPSDSGRRMKQDTFSGISRIVNFGIGGTVSVIP